MNPSEPLSLGIFNSNTSLSSYNFFSFHLLVNILIFLLSSNRTAILSWTVYILCPLIFPNLVCVRVHVCAHACVRACTQQAADALRSFLRFTSSTTSPNRTDLSFSSQPPQQFLFYCPILNGPHSATDISVPHCQSEFLRTGHTLNHNNELIAGLSECKIVSKWLNLWEVGEEEREARNIASSESRHSTAVKKKNSRTNCQGSNPSPAIF